MDTQYYKKVLLDKQRDLEEQIARLGDSAQTDATDVLDHSETAAVEESSSDALDAATALTHTLEAVRDALQRIEAGTFGTCALCDQPIEPARLEAVPWTLYCLKDQQKLEARRGTPQGATL